MKRTVCFMVLISVFMIFGCKKVAVEDVAKDHVKKQFKLVDNAKLDLSKLKYTVIKKEGDKATVNISGPIQYDGQIILVKDGRKWKIEGSAKKCPKCGWGVAADFWTHCPWCTHKLHK